MSKEKYFYQPASEIKKQFCISNSTLRRWADDSLIRCVRYGVSGKRLYHIQDLKKRFGLSAIEGDPTKQQVEKIIYARVSSAHQKEDLQRQIQDLQTAFPEHKVISDIGSGLNFKRKGFTTLLEQVFDGMVKEVVVMHKDRLCRYGTELVEFIFKKTGTRLLVYGQDETTSTQELADDLLAITTVFVARNNGKRSAANRKRRRQQKQEATIEGT